MVAARRSSEAAGIDAAARATARVAVAFPAGHRPWPVRSCRGRSGRGDRSLRVHGSRSRIFIGDAGYGDRRLSYRVCRYGNAGAASSRIPVWLSHRDNRWRGRRFVHRRVRLLADRLSQHGRVHDHRACYDPFVSRAGDTGRRTDRADFRARVWQVVSRFRCRTVRRLFQALWRLCRYRACVHRAVSNQRLRPRDTGESLLSRRRF